MIVKIYFSNVLIHEVTGYHLQVDRDKLNVYTLNRKSPLNQEKNERVISNMLTTLTNLAGSK